MNASAESNRQPNPSAAAEKKIRDKVTEISAHRTPEQVRLLIADWKEREPDSPDPYIVSASYELQLGRQPMQVYETATGNQTHPGKDGATEYPVVDKSGRQAGVIGVVPTGPPPDPATVKKQQLRAAVELEEALKKFPNRIDLMIGRAMALGEAREWDVLAQHMESILQRAANDPENLRSYGNEKPSRSPADELLGGLQGFITSAINEQDLERARHFAQLGLKYFSERGELLSDMGSIHFMSQQWDEAVPYFEHARQVAPEDNVILLNLTLVYLQLGRADDARATAREIVRLHRDIAITNTALDILHRLDSQSPTGRP